MISPKLIDVEGNRIETSDTYEYKNGPKGNTFSVGNLPFIFILTGSILFPTLY